MDSNHEEEEELIERKESEAEFESRFKENIETFRDDVTFHHTEYPADAILVKDYQTILYWIEFKVETYHIKKNRLGKRIVVEQYQHDHANKGSKAEKFYYLVAEMESKSLKKYYVLDSKAIRKFYAQFKSKKSGSIKFLGRRQEHLIKMKEYEKKEHIFSYNEFNDLINFFKKKIMEKIENCNRNIKI